MNKKDENNSNNIIKNLENKKSKTKVKIKKKNIKMENTADILKDNSYNKLQLSENKNPQKNNSNNNNIIYHINNNVTLNYMI